MGIGSKLGLKARKRWSLVILLVGLPIYIVAVITVLNWMGKPPFLVELLVYVALGVVWILPFKSVFRGIGQVDSDEDQR